MCILKNDAHQEFVCFRRSKKVHYIEGKERGEDGNCFASSEMPRCQDAKHFREGAKRMNHVITISILADNTSEFPQHSTI